MGIQANHRQVRALIVPQTDRRPDAAARYVAVARIVEGVRVWWSDDDGWGALRSKALESDVFELRPGRHGSAASSDGPLGLWPCRGT